MVFGSGGFWGARVAEGFTRFDLDADRLAELMLRIEQAGDGNERAAVGQWVDDNPDLVDEWLGR